MLWQAFGVLLHVAIYMIMKIHLMKFFLRTAHRYSKTTDGGRREKEDLFQVLCQVNGSRPAGCVCVISMILKHHRAQGHGAKLTNCISMSLLLLVDILYVDDAELSETAQSGL